MPTQEDVRRIALSLEETREAEDGFRFYVAAKPKDKLFVWAWNERVDPKKPRVPREDVLAVRVANLDAKDALLSAGPKKFFTEPHYDGYPAVLVRLRAIGKRELEALITEAWRVSRGPRRRT